MLMKAESGLLMLSLSLQLPFKPGKLSFLFLFQTLFLRQRLGALFPRFASNGTHNFTSLNLNYNAIPLILFFNNQRRFVGLVWIELHTPWVRVWKEEFLGCQCSYPCLYKSAGPCMCERFSFIPIGFTYGIIESFLSMEEEVIVIVHSESRYGNQLQKMQIIHENPLCTEKKISEENVRNQPQNRRILT